LTQAESAPIVESTEPWSVSARSWLRRYGTLAAIVFVVAVTVRVGFIVWRGPLMAPDSVRYARLARNLRDHGTFTLANAPPYVPTSRRPPVYPAMLAVFPWNNGDQPPLGIFALQILLDACVAVLVLVFALAVVPRRWAVGAALVSAIHPGPVTFSSFLLTESLFTALVAASAAATLVALRRESGWAAALAGVAMGLATLCRPIALLLPFVLGAIVVARGGRGRALRAALLVGCAALVVVPWCVRSSLIAGTLVVVQSGVGTNVIGPTLDKSESVRDYYGVEESPTGQAGEDGAATGRAVARILDSPLEYVKRRLVEYPALVWSRFPYVTGLESNADLLARRSWFRLALILVVGVGFSLVPLPLAAIGLWRARGDAAILCAAIWVYTLVVHLPLWTEYRFWATVTPFLIVSAAAGAHHLFAVWQRRRTRAPAEGVDR
jgi:4-amino-4-deoxy-L-arabinose transferase-like glycosyltransferase